MHHEKDSLAAARGILLALLLSGIFWALVFSGVTDWFRESTSLRVVPVFCKRWFRRLDTRHQPRACAHSGQDA